MKGIILNRYDAADAVMRDNKKMVEILTRVPVIACVKKDEAAIAIDAATWPDCMDRGCRMDLVEKDLKYIWHPCSQMKDYEELKPVIIDRGEGVFLYDKDGKTYLDIVSSWWCNLLGHCNPTMNASAHRPDRPAVEHVIFANFSHEPAIALCEQLMEIIPTGLSKFNFSDNGSAAVECALKMSFQYQYQTGHKEKTKFMCLTEGYHGETLGALAVGGMDLYAKMYQPMLMDTNQIEAPDCYRCPFQQNRDSCNCECFALCRKSLCGPR